MGPRVKPEDDSKGPEDDSKGPEDGRRGEGGTEGPDADGTRRADDSAGRMATASYGA